MKLFHALPALVSSAALSHAAVLYTTDFPEAVNTLPSNWSVLAGGTGSTTTDGWYIDGNGDYRFSSSVAGTNALTRYNGSLIGGASALTLTNFTVETSFTRTNGVLGGFGGLAGRIVDANNFYHARIFADNQFQIYHFSSGGNNLLTSFTLDPADAFASDEKWTLSMTFNGSNISASLYNELNQLVHTLSVTNTAIASGGAGIRSQGGYAYDHFTISEIPEHSAAMLGGIALLSAAVSRRRKH